MTHRHEREVEEAVQISCSPCAFCPAIHINLIDAAGEIFATASLPAASLEAFIEDLRGAARHVAERSPTTAVRQ